MWSFTSAGGRITCLSQRREKGTGAACTELDSGSEPVDNLHESLLWAGETDHGMLRAAGNGASNGVRDWRSRQAPPVPIVVRILGLIQPRNQECLRAGEDHAVLQEAPPVLSVFLMERELLLCPFLSSIAVSPHLSPSVPHPCIWGGGALSHTLWKDGSSASLLPSSPGWGKCSSSLRVLGCRLPPPYRYRITGISLSVLKQIDPSEQKTLANLPWIVEPGQDNKRGINTKYETTIF